MLKFNSKEKVFELEANHLQSNSTFFKNFWKGETIDLSFIEHKNLQFFYDYMRKVFSRITDMDVNSLNQMADLLGCDSLKEYIKLSVNAVECIEQYKRDGFVSQEIISFEIVKNYTEDKKYLNHLEKQSLKWRQKEVFLKNIDFDEFMEIYFKCFKKEDFLKSFLTFLVQYEHRNFDKPDLKHELFFNSLCIKYKIFSSNSVRQIKEILEQKNEN